MFSVRCIGWCAYRPITGRCRRGRGLGHVRGRGRGRGLGRGLGRCGGRDHGLGRGRRNLSGEREPGQPTFFINFNF